MGIIVGMQDQPVYFTDFVHSPYLSDEPLDVFKTHETNLAEVAARFGPDYRLFFIGSERTISEKMDRVSTGRAGAQSAVPSEQAIRFSTNKFVDSFRDHDNVAIFDFKDISDQTVCGNLYGVVGFMAPYVELDYEGCLARVEAMNRRVGEIAEQPFSYVDPFFGVHGSHRSRPKTDGVHFGTKRLRGAKKN
jgi:hypothetical protein